MQFSYMMVIIQKGKKNIEDPDMNQLEYTGELNEEDQAYGQGMSSYTHKSSMVRYYGTFVEDKYEGIGTLIDQHGNVFDGEFKAGRLHGSVTFREYK